MKSTTDPTPEESVSRLSSARKLLVLALIAGVVFLIIYFVFLNDDSADSEVATPATTEAAKEPQFVKEGELAFLNDAGQDTLQAIDIEIAEGREEQAQGLMYRSSMNENNGMLFIYPEERPLSFYMKNTKISLDIIYADEDKKIVTIHQGVMPYSEKTLPSGEDAQYVVEVNAGFTSRHGIEEGDLITYEADTP